MRRALAAPDAEVAPELAALLARADVAAAAVTGSAHPTEEQLVSWHHFGYLPDVWTHFPPPETLPDVRPEHRYSRLTPRARQLIEGMEMHSTLVRFVDTAVDVAECCTIGELNGALMTRCGVMFVVAGVQLFHRVATGASVRLGLVVAVTTLTARYAALLVFDVADERVEPMLRDPVRCRLTYDAARDIRIRPPRRALIFYPCRCVSAESVDKRGV